MIYLLSCKCCVKQYAAETTDSLRYRWNNYKDNDKKHSCKDSCMQEHLFKHFNSLRHNGFINNVSITRIDRPTVKTLNRKKISGGKLWKPTRPLDLMLKTVSDQPHITKYVEYGLPFYGIVRILVRQGLFMD